MQLKRITSTSNIDFYSADITSAEPLPFVDGISAGFPSPAEEYIELAIDLNKELVKHPSSTFYGRVRGNSMKDANINDGDILIIDKSLPPRNGQKAVCFINGEFTIKTLKIEKGKVWLVPANEKYKTLEITPDNDFIVWGIVTYVIHKV
ncbi:MAG: peptidase S24 [Bacteroidetes bacterium HGW-Bacteroidetes-21]|jgi:DNA polymerase V|nr:MAG: peptidase S24 [Bacteroidetes bacterium HGW-Bacteroidetes-21]